MKNFDLNAYGVEEMSQKEILTENGGILWFVFAAVAAGMIYDFVSNTAECLGAMSAGYNAARK